MFYFKQKKIMPALFKKWKPDNKPSLKQIRSFNNSINKMMNLKNKQSSLKKNAIELKLSINNYAAILKVQFQKIRTYQWN